MKPETRFRVNKVNPFLKTLKRDAYVDAIQQVSKGGTPDYYICIKGDFVGLEIKVRGGSLSELQKDKRYLIKESGGIYIATSPEGEVPETIPWEEAKVILTALAKGEREWAIQHLKKHQNQKV